MALAVTAMIGNLRQRGSLRISTVASKPSISGIITSINTRSMSSTSFNRSIASRPLRPMTTTAPFCSSALVRAKMLRTSSSTSSTLRPSKTRSRLRATLSILCLSWDNRDSTLCRKSVTSSSRRSGERAPLMMIEREYLRSSASSSRVRLRPV
ncbi:hypothetical protein D3C81_1859690 [compost metagenome]